MEAKKLGQFAPSGDRRQSSRLPIMEAVRYKIVGGRKGSEQSGSGKTLNMSSGGVLFSTESFLPQGLRVEVAVNWPATLDGVALKLVIVGRVVWAESAQAAVSIERYEFRTRRSELSSGELRKVS